MFQPSRLVKGNRQQCKLDDENKGHSYAIFRIGQFNTFFYKSIEHTYFKTIWRFDSSSLKRQANLVFRTCLMFLSFDSRQRCYFCIFISSSSNLVFRSNFFSFVWNWKVKNLRYQFTSHGRLRMYIKIDERDLASFRASLYQPL